MGVTGAWTKPALWIVAGVLMLLTVVTTADSFIKPVNWTTSSSTANIIDVSFSYSAFMTPTSSGCNSGLSTANTIDVSFSYSAFMTPPSSFSTATTTTTTVFPSSDTFGSFPFSDYSSLNLFTTPPFYVGCSGSFIKPEKWTTVTTTNEAAVGSLF